MHIIAQGTERVKVIEWKQEDPYLLAVVQILPEVQVKDPEEVEATKRNVQAMVQEALALLPERDTGPVDGALVASITPRTIITASWPIFWVRSSTSVSSRSRRCSKPIRLTHY